MVRIDSQNTRICGAESEVDSRYFARYDKNRKGDFIVSKAGDV